MHKPSQQVAKHFREVFFGGNWTVSNFKDQLSGVSWTQATTKHSDLNTIATLTYHIGYYVSVALKVYQGEELNSKDELSFTHPTIESQEDWEAMVKEILDNAEKLAGSIEQLPDDQLSEDFTDPKYGSYYRNMHGIIEHTYYHLGQIALLKKLV